MVVNLRGLDKYGGKHTGTRTNVQANIRGTYGRIRTDGVNKRRNERSIYEKAKIRELYVQMTELIFGKNISHNFFKILHTRVRKTKQL